MSIFIFAYERPSFLLLHTCCTGGRVQVNFDMRTSSLRRRCSSFFPSLTRETRNNFSLVCRETRTGREAISVSRLFWRIWNKLMRVPATVTESIDRRKPWNIFVIQASKRHQEKEVYLSTIFASVFPLRSIKMLPKTASRSAVSTMSVLPKIVFRKNLIKIIWTVTWATYDYDNVHIKFGVCLARIGKRVLLP